MMRAFIAVDFDHDVKENIAHVQKVVQNHATAGRWKQLDNFHLTLEFLGNITPGEMDRICLLMGEVAGRHVPFELRLGKIGFFKGRGVFRVVWLGIEGDQDALNALQRDVKDTLALLNFKDDNRFSPHVTLGQDVKLDVPFEQLKDTVSAGKDPIYVRAFCLMDSRVIDGRRIYTPVKQFDLSGR